MSTSSDSYDPGTSESEVERLSLLQGKSFVVRIFYSPIVEVVLRLRYRISKTGPLLRQIFLSLETSRKVSLTEMNFVSHSSSSDRTRTVVVFKPPLR